MGRSLARGTALLKSFGKKRLDGDGVVVSGTTIAITEAKAYANGGGATADDKKKMREHRQLIKDKAKVPGYITHPDNGSIATCDLGAASRDAEARPRIRFDGGSLTGPARRRGPSSRIRRT